jgi:hypothetical protein
MESPHTTQAAATLLAAPKASSRHGIVAHSSQAEFSTATRFFLRVAAAVARACFSFTMASAFFAVPSVAAMAVSSSSRVRSLGDWRPLAPPSPGCHIPARHKRVTRKRELGEGERDSLGYQEILPRRVSRLASPGTRASRSRVGLVDLGVALRQRRLFVMFLSPLGLNSLFHT